MHRSWPIKRNHFIFLAILLIITAGFFAILPNIGLWLIIRDPVPPNINVVFTFGGEEARYPYSGQLAAQFPQAVWIASCGYYLPRHICPETKSYPVKPGQIIDTCTSTWSEVSFLLSWLKGKKPLQDSIWQPVIGLVSSPYHMRRIKVAVDRQAKGMNCRFIYLAVPSEIYPYPDKSFAQWYRSKALANVVLSEWKKILYYSFR
jgi:hypothetical protein